MRILNQREEVSNIVTKTRYFIIVLLLSFTVLFIRVAYLQMFRGEELYASSQDNFTISEKITAPRGDIYTADGALLAITRPSFRISVIPLFFVKSHDLIDKQIRRLNSIMEMTSGELRRFRKKLMNCTGQCRYHPVTVKEGIPRKTILELSSYLTAFPGTIIGSGFKREYPFGEDASHITGYVSKISTEERKQFPDFSPESFTGKSGIERSFEKHLHGTSGERYHVIDRMGRIIELPESIDNNLPESRKPLKGDNITTTLFSYLQKEAARAFRKKSGGVVMMNIHTGDILAMYSSPAYDPNLLSRKRISASIWEQYSESILNPLVNKTISETYYPGSTFKIVPAMAGLYYNVITEKSTYFCNGCLSFGEYRKCCWKRAGHKWVNLRKSLKESCDIFYYRLIDDLGFDRFVSFTDLFKLGELTGISLPNEKPGTVPSRPWFRTHYPHRSITLGYMMNLAIGQGDIRLTPLRMNVLYGAVFNGGIVIRPRIVKSFDPHDGPSHEIPVTAERRLSMPERVLDAIKQALWAVTNEKGGTGYYAADHSLPDAAGKTGTSQVISKSKRNLISFSEEEKRLMTKDHAFFTGVFPYNNPQVVATAVVEHGGHGGAVAAPIVFNLFAQYYHKQRISE